jgi:catechol 2,3-dioxygenase-like lactoylglutathione lyase family enzyme
MRIHHVALRTQDVPRLLEFYAGTLGLRVLEHEHSVWLEAGDAIVMLEARGPSEPDVPVGSMEMIAFAISPEERAALARRLPVESETRFTIYVRDPDGRRVGLSHYPLSYPAEP